MGTITPLLARTSLDPKLGGGGQLEEDCGHHENCNSCHLPSVITLSVRKGLVAKKEVEIHGHFICVVGDRVPYFQHIFLTCANHPEKNMVYTLRSEESLVM